MSAAQGRKPQPGDNYISKDAVIRAGAQKHEVTIGHGTVVHPYAVIDSTNGPIQIGDYCVISEFASIVNTVSSAAASPTDGSKRMVVGSYNIFAPRCVIEALRVGDGNKFGAMSSVGIMSVVEDYCVLNAKTRVTHDAVVPSRCVVFGEGNVWADRVAVDEAEEKERAIALSRFYRKHLPRDDSV